MTNINVFIYKNSIIAKNLHAFLPNHINAQTWHIFLPHLHGLHVLPNDHHLHILKLRPERGRPPQLHHELPRLHGFKPVRSQMQSLFQDPNDNRQYWAWLQCGHWSVCALYS
jgi:hypothetical protein